MQEEDASAGLDTVRLKSLNALGVRATDFTITCKSIPRCALLASDVDEQLKVADPVGLADDLVSPPEARTGSGGALGGLTAAKIAALCAGTRPPCALLVLCSASAAAAASRGDAACIAAARQHTLTAPCIASERGEPCSAACACMHVLHACGGGGAEATRRAACVQEACWCAWGCWCLSGTAGGSGGARRRPRRSPSSWTA